MNWLTYHRRERAKTYNKDNQMLSLQILKNLEIDAHRKKTI